MVSRKGENIDDKQFGFKKQRSKTYAISKLTAKILNGFRKKEKATAIFFDIEKTYDKVNRNKTFTQLENMRIQGRMMEFIRK